jgi:hypothetical protein
MIYNPPYNLSISIGFFDYGKYSKSSDHNLRELYQMMTKNGEDVSEIELEL